MFSRFCFLAILAFGLMFALPNLTKVEAQSNDGKLINDPDGKFSINLPNTDWAAVESTDGLGRKQIEIVYKIREDGLLKIRRVDIEKSSKLMDAVNKDESQTLIFLPGYTKGALEDFSAAGGKVPAIMKSYDYTQGGRPKMGRHYYLMIDEATVYILRFTGNRSTMQALRSQTDVLARSFKVK